MDGWEEKPTEWETEPDDLIEIMHNYKSIYSDIDFSSYNNIDLDAIFVLAGGLKDDGGVHEWVLRRLDLAYNIYKNHKNKDKDKGLKIVCLGGGTYHKPPILNNDQYVVHESTACAEYLINVGVDPKNIYKEWASYDTIANGYFAFINYIVPMGLKNVMVITSEFHMKRSKSIFQWIQRINNSMCNLYFIKASDNNLGEIIKKRISREKNSLENLKKNLFPKINTIKEFHRWFYEDHKAYCSYSSMIEKEDATSSEKKSY